MAEMLCMIPVRAGSERGRGKALRSIAHTTLVEQAITLALTKFSPSSIYLNTNWDELESLANNYGISFYRRDDSLCAASSTNDEFMNDFFLSTSCERVVQLLPTSPFLLASEFSDFVDISRDSDNKAVVSVASHQSENHISFFLRYLLVSPRSPKPFFIFGSYFTESTHESIVEAL